MMVSTIFPIYFNYLAGNAGISDVDYLAYWGYATSVCTLLVAVLGPTLGAIADTKILRKQCFCCDGSRCFRMYFVRFLSSWIWFLGIFVLAKTGYSASLIFYDAMLTDVTDPERMDAVSSHGYAWGYIGSCIPFVACLGVVLGAKPLGIGMQTAMIIAFIITALWWLLSSVPLLRSLQTEIFCRSKRTCCKKTVLSGLGKLFAELVKEKHIFVFLLAFSFILTVCIPLLIWRQRTDRLLIDSTGLFTRPSCDTDRCVSVCTYFRKDRKESFSGEDHYCLYHGIFWNCSVCNIGWILSLISGCSQFLWECSRERYRRFQDHILRRSYRRRSRENISAFMTFAAKAHRLSERRSYLLSVR